MQFISVMPNRLRIRSGAIFLALAWLCLAAAAACQQSDGSSSITIFHTTDEHGNLLPLSSPESEYTQGGAANLLSWLVEREGYDRESHILLSGGDNWTGASISTWFEGIPMVQAFNYMGYDAAAIGNHEFDFGREQMEHRFDEAEYPYLAANIRYKDGGLPVEFAEPYVILERNGVHVGIVGLSTLSTQTSTHPRNVNDLRFTEYVEALETYVPRMREDGADVVVVLGHVCARELVEVAEQHPGIADMMLAGHCHQRFERAVNGIPIVSSGSRMRSYSRIDITFDTAAKQVVDVETDVNRVRYVTEEGNPVEPHRELSALVEEWSAQTDSLLGEEIGYTSTGIERRSAVMGNWVTDAWLWAYPHAEIALTNWPGFRAPIDTGSITIGDIVAVMPFENRIVEVEISGEQLRSNLLCCGGAAAGIRYDREGQVQLTSGRAFHPDSTYYLLINDFMYEGGAGFLFDEQNLDSYDTSIHWRQPVIDYTKSLGTTRGSPLEAVVDSVGRTSRER